MAGTSIKLLMGPKANINNVANVMGQLLFTTDEGNHIFFDTAEGRKELYSDVISNVSSLTTLVGSKSVATQIQEAIAKLTSPPTEGEPAPTVQLVTEVKAGDGILIDSTDGSKPIVSVKLRAENNVIKKAADGSLYVDKNDAKDYTVVVETVADGDSSLPAGVAKAYRIKQEATGLDTMINIPKDMVVSSGTVTTYSESDSLPTGVTTAGTYLVLTLANATNDKVYINVEDLITQVTSGSAAGDDIVVAVSADNKITATLSATIKASLALADTAVQPNELKADEETNKFISGIAVDEAGVITIKKGSVPSFDWETF